MTAGPEVQGYVQLYSKFEAAVPNRKIRKKKLKVNTSRGGEM